MSQHGLPERLSGKSKPLDDEVVCPGQGTMEILVESLTGSAFQMTVSPNDTIHAIKSKIFRVEGIPLFHQHLLYNLKELEDSRSLSDYNIKDGSTLRLVLSIHGGPISTRRLPLPSVEDLNWRDIKDFVENNRDEAGEWLPPGCKMLVFKDGNNVNLLKVIEDDDDDHYTTLSDYSFSDETAVTMCKMIDLRSKMEKLSMKRNKKKITSKSKRWMNRVENVSTTNIKRTTSEENISSTFKGVFDETPNFTKYNYGKMSSNLKNASDDNISNYCSIFQIEPQTSRSSNKNDKFGLWQPINSLSEISTNESGSSPWQPCGARSFLSRESSTSDFFKNKSDCSSSTESFKDSILAGTLGKGGGHDPQDDGFGDSVTAREAPDILAGDVLSQSNSNQPNVVGSGPGGVVLETTTVPTPALPLPLVAHSPNTGSNYGDYRMTPSTSCQYDEPNQSYYYKSGAGSSQIKRVVRKMMFRSNSHLNSPPSPSPSYAPGSDSRLDQLDHLPEERTSHSISNLFFNSHGNAKLSLPSVDRTWSSELDKAESIKYKRTSVRPGNMVFSSSTSDLLGLKKHKILPSLSRHPNCERLDVSDDNLHNIDTLKSEPLPSFKSTGDNHLNNITQLDNNKSGAVNSVCAPSIVSWPNPGFNTKTFTTTSLSDSRPRSSHHLVDKSNKNTLNNIRYIQNGEDLGNSSTGITTLPFQYGVPGGGRTNLEVGSERRCKRIKKILKLDHNNISDKNRAEVVSRKNFLLGYGGHGYEASIQKMPNTYHMPSEKDTEPTYYRESSFTPLYERCLRVYSNRRTNTSQDKIENTSKLISGLKDLNTSVENVVEKPLESVILTQSERQEEITNNNDDVKKPKRIRCAFCKKRLSIASIHTCRCGVTFCAPHRYAEVHGCQYDYKAEGQDYLRRANPLVSAPKLPKI